MKKNLGIILLLISVAIISWGWKHHAQEAENKVEIRATSSYKQQKAWQIVAGEMQSPINIKTQQVKNMRTDAGEIVLKYQPVLTEVMTKEHTYEAKVNGTAELNGRSFELQQIHFHAKSEHTVNGKHYPMEAHFVHQAEDGRLAVLAVFFQVGQENPAFETILQKAQKKGAAVEFAPETLLPKNKSYYHYLGSLTTPPLTENVEWYIYKEPVMLSQAQLHSFVEKYAHTNRATQKINQRMVLEKNT